MCLENTLIPSMQDERKRNVKRIKCAKEIEGFDNTMAF